VTSGEDGENRGFGAGFYDTGGRMWNWDLLNLLGKIIKKILWLGHIERNAEKSSNKN